MTAGPFPAADRASGVDLAAVAFAGVLRLAPGAGAGSLRRERLAGLDRLWRGQPAEAWPGRAAAVFSLCAQAHRWTARRAVQAARGETSVPDAAALEGLRWATVQEHARRLLLDWPAAWPLGEPHRAAALDALRASPADTADTAAREAGWAHWLAAAVLGQPPDDWLRRAGEGGESWLAGWADATDTPVARWLAALRPVALAPLPCRALSELGELAPALAQRLGAPDGADFATAPEGPDGPLETGPWARSAFGPAAGAHNAWMRMTGRLVDLVRLARPGGAACLAQGQRAGGDGTGLAWSGTARGMLLHWVRLERDGAGGERVADAHIVAPTDWNTHPRGALACALAALPPGREAMPQARALALAFDPCVPVHWAEPAESGPALPREASHA